MSLAEEDITGAADEALASAEQAIRSGGRPRIARVIDRPVNAWSTGQLAYVIGMSSWFVSKEIATGEIKASRFGTEYRIHVDEVRRYLTDKGFPLPEWMRESR
mgnify:CR=1 FL=1